MARDNIIDKGSTKTSPWFGYKYRVTPETSKLLQEAVFADGGGWNFNGRTKVQHLENEYLYIYENGEISYGNSYCDFQSDYRVEKEPPQVERKTLQENTVSVTMTPTDVNAVIKHFNQQEDVNMSNVNRVVSVKFFDDDAGLKAEHALVAEYQVTTRVSDAMTVSKVLLTNDVAGDIDLHNKVRSETVDLHILKNTGNKVMLQPVEFEDLRVTVTNI